MPKLFLAGENIASSPAVVGFRIMKMFDLKSESAISIFDVVSRYRTEPWFSPKSLYLGMIFLYATGLIDFRAPHIVKRDD